MRRLACTTCCLVLGWIMLGSQSMAQYPVAVGDQHPDYSFPDIGNGEAVKISDFRGRKLLLVHFASW